LISIRKSKTFFVFHKLSLDTEILSEPVLGVVFASPGNAVETHGLLGEIPAQVRAVVIDGTGIVLAESGTPAGDDRFPAVPGFDHLHMLMEIEIPLRIGFQLGREILQTDADELAALRSAFAAIRVCHS
jgi:hypothetical protein